MSTTTDRRIQSRFLMLVRNDNDLEQAIIKTGVHTLTLTEGLGRLNDLLEAAAPVAAQLGLPQLVTGREYNNFSVLLSTSRLMSRRPKAELNEYSLRGILPEGDYLPVPAYRCQLVTGDTVDFNRQTIYPMLTFEGQYPIFREVQWLLRCWDAVIRGVWASKLFREIGRAFNGPKALMSAFVSPKGESEVISNWLAWEGPAWPVLEMEEYDDERLKAVWEFCHEQSMGSYDCQLRSVVQIHEWFKQKSIADVEKLGLTDDETDNLLFWTSQGMHEPNLEIRLQFSVEAQRFVLQFPLKAHNRTGYNNELFTIPQSVLDQFLAEANDQFKTDLIRILVSTYKYAIIRLTSDMIEPDLY